MASGSWIRGVARRSLRDSWYWLRAIGFRLPPEALLHSPLDLKVGRHFLAPPSDPRLLAVCDLACLSFSYDIVKFLALADRKREEAGVEKFDIAVVAHGEDPYPTPHAAVDPITRENHRSYVHNLALDAAKLFRAAGSLLYFDDRPAFADYWRRVRRTRQTLPANYDPRQPNFEDANGAPLYGLTHLRRPDGSLHAPLTAPEVDRELVRAWIAARLPGPCRVITITLRGASRAPERNSDPAAWQALIDGYRGTDLRFVVLQDFAELYRGTKLKGPNVVECPEAVISLSFRAALYEAATHNMMIGGGPATLCYLNPRATYTVFGIGGDADPDHDAELLLQHGLQRGGQLVDGDPSRTLVWERDGIDALRHGLDTALKHLSASSHS